VKSVYKYPLTDAMSPTDVLSVNIASFTVMMPHDAIILHFAMQRDTPTIWALVDSENAKEPRSFKVVGTGKEIKFNTDEYVYLGTAMTFSHDAVVHLFEKVTE